MYSKSEFLTSEAGLPHSDIFGSSRRCQLPEAFRRLLRPSSPLTAKASTVCAYSLDHIILNDLVNLRSISTFNIHRYLCLVPPKFLKNISKNILLDLVEPIGIEPMTSCLQSRRSTN